MADIKVRFEVNPNAETEFLGDVKNDNAVVSNVSLRLNNVNIFQDIPTMESDGINGLSFAQDLVFDGQEYVDNVDLQGGVIESEQNPTEFIWGVVPESKEYSVKLTFTNAQNLKDIIVYGNRITNQFPTRAIIDGTTEIFSDDYRWAINLQSESSTHTIEFTHWNRENYNASLTFIAVMMRYLELDKYSGLKQIESISQKTGQPREIYYGVITSTGDVKFVDYSGDFKDFIFDDILDINNMPVEIYSNGKKTQEHIIINSTNEDGFSVSCSLSNRLDLYKQINIKAFLTNRRKGYIFSLYELLREVVKTNIYSSEDDTNAFLNTLTSEKVYISRFGNIAGEEITIEEYLKRIFNKDGNIYVSSSSFYDFLQKICEATQLNLMQKDNGDIVFVSARPIIQLGENKYIVSKNKQFSSFASDFFIKNKYDAISYNKQIIENDFVTTSQNITLHNSEGDTDLSYLDNGQFIYVDGNMYLCFFITLSGSSPMFSNLYDDNRDEDMQENIPLSSFKITYRASGSSEDTEYGSFFKGDFSLKNSYIKKESFNFLDAINNNQRYVILQKHSTDTSITLAICAFLSGWDDTEMAKYELGSVSVDLVHRTISRNSEATIFGDGSNFFNFQNNNELIGTNFLFLSKPAYDYGYSGTYASTLGSYNYESLYDVIFNNIIKDYQYGIKTSTLTVPCSDFSDGVKNDSINWENGDVLQVGDCVNVDGHKGNWMISGRTFRYSGVPMIDLELQECRTLEYEHKYFDFEFTSEEVQNIYLPDMFSEMIDREIQLTIVGEDSKIILTQESKTYSWDSYSVYASFLQEGENNIRFWDKSLNLVGKSAQLKYTILKTSR